MKTIQSILMTSLLLTNEIIPLEEEVQLTISNTDQWTQSIEVTIENTDCLYSMDGINFQENNHFMIYENGMYSFFIQKEDRVKQKEIQISNIDLEPPLFDKGNEYIHTGYKNQIIEIHAKDNGCGIQTYKLTTNKNEYISSLNTFTLQDEKEKLLKIEVLDVLQNKSELEIESMYPSNLFVLPCSNLNTISKKKQFEIKCENSTHYAISNKYVDADDESLSYTTNTMLEITENGRYYIYAKNVDKGEFFIEEPSILEVTSIDSVSPTIEDIRIVSNHETNKEYSNSQKGVTVQIVAKDEMKDCEGNIISSNAKLQYYLNDESNDTGRFVVYENGDYEGKVIDTAGNETIQKIVVENIDADKPIFDVVPFEYENEDEDMVLKKEDLNLEIQIQDECSGINEEHTYVKVNEERVNGKIENGGIHFMISKENESFNLFFHIEDLVGNTKEEKLNDKPIYIDKEKPEIEEIKKEGILFQNKEWLKEEMLEYQLKDMSSGLASYSIYVNDELYKEERFEKDIHDYTIQIDPQSLSTTNDGKAFVEIKVLDHASNLSLYQQEYNIDFQPPILIYSFDQTLNSNYYPFSRTLTIQIQEMNFDPENIECSVPLSWTLVSGSVGCKDAIWQASIPFSQDGKVDFVLDGKDGLEYPLTNSIHEEFIIDQTNPHVSISFSNNHSTNQIYFNSSRLCTIQIIEDNFDESLVKIHGQNLPAVSNWMHEGNHHTLQIPFVQDGKYDMQLEVEDKAGNHSKSLEIPLFEIDQTKPSIQILNVESQKAYSNSIRPIIECRDSNYESLQASILSVDGYEVWKKNQSLIRDGKQIEFMDLDHVQIQDGKYILHVEAKDKADNVVIQDVVFYVNRFGSLYRPSTYFKSVLDSKYNQKVEDLSFKELNVNQLSNQSVRINHNGKIQEVKWKQNHTINKDWNEYEYILSKEYFKEDGIYEIYVSSIDGAGNQNENTNEKKQSNFIFALDQTKPMISISGIESNQFYNVHKKEFEVMVYDNMELDVVEVYINGKKVDTFTDENRKSFTLEESSKNQTILVKAVDKAGNSVEKELKSIMVTTNPVIRFFSNLYNGIALLLFLMISISLAGWRMYEKLRGRKE